MVLLEISRNKTCENSSWRWKENKTRSWDTGKWVDPGASLNLLQGSRFQSDELFAELVQPTPLHQTWMEVEPPGNICACSSLTEMRLRNKGKPTWLVVFFLTSELWCFGCWLRKHIAEGRGFADKVGECFPVDSSYMKMPFLPPWIWIVLFSVFCLFGWLFCFGFCSCFLFFPPYFPQRYCKNTWREGGRCRQVGMEETVVCVYEAEVLIPRTASLLVFFN